MKRAVILTVAVAMLVLAGSAVGANVRRCGLVSYRGIYHGQPYAGMTSWSLFENNGWRWEP